LGEPTLQKALDAEKRKNHQMQLQVDDYRGFHSRHITDLRDKDRRIGVLNAELASKDRRIRELESDLGKANARLEASVVSFTDFSSKMPESGQ